MDEWLDGLAFELARSQHGLVSHAQAVAMGFSKEQIAYRVRTKRWQKVSTGVYQLYASEPTFPWRAALAWLQLGDQAVASHRCAATLRGLDGVSLSALEFTTARRRRKGRAGVTLHYVSEIPDGDWSLVDGIPTTTVTRTIVDLACDSTVPFGDLERVFEAGQRRKETSHAEVRALLDTRSGPGHRGTRRARQLCELLVDDGRVNHSDLETRFFQLLRTAGLPLPARQRVIERSDGRLASADYAYDDCDGLIELVGFRWHSSSAALRSDVERSNEIQLQRKVVLQFTWEHVTKRRRYVVEKVRALRGRSL